MMNYERPIKKSYTKTVGVVLGTLVILAFFGFLMAAAPGKTMLQASGASENPISGAPNVYSLKNIDCAFGQMSCNLG